MKKLKLSELNLGDTEVLTREQLKKVLGGIGFGTGSGGSGGDLPCAQCCWADYPDDCGPCACGTICVPGSFLKGCVNYIQCLHPPCDY